MGRRGTVVAMALMIWAGASLWGCEEDKLQESERVEIGKVLQTGVSLGEDEYVRAETFRVLELMADPGFDEFALKGVEDASEMVRLAALRALLATENAQAERLALVAYAQASVLGRQALTEAAIEYGPQKLREELFVRGVRSTAPQLRRFAFEAGVLTQVKHAIVTTQQKLLQAQWIPQLSTYVDHDDTFIASRALRTLRTLGREDRADPLLAQFQRQDTPLPVRVRLAKVLGLAGVEGAKPGFEQVLNRLEEAQQKSTKKLGLPQSMPDPLLVRAATLGLVALGDETHVAGAQAYLNQASVEESMEVLEHLAQNGSAEALVSLKVAMSDARPPVRRLAASLYGQQAGAKAKDLISALSQPDPVLRRNIANILVARFPKKWGMNLRMQLRAEDRKDPTLSLLRQVVDRKHDAEVLEAIKEQLQDLSAEVEKGERAAMASYLLLLLSPDDPTTKEAIANSSDVRTRYVFLEHLLKHDPEASTPIFRRYFFDDLYTIRLMSAAGLWQAYKKKQAGTQGA